VSRSRAVPWLLPVLVLVLAGCGNGEEPAADDRPAAAAPTRVPIGGHELVLSLFVWRDQMPTVGDEPGPCASLCVSGTVEDLGAEPLPEDLEVLDVVAVVDGERRRFEELELPGLVGPSAFEFVGRGGPRLEVGTRLDVAVLVALEGVETWLRGADVTVERTV
jgi:hypothetical protein